MNLLHKSRSLFLYLVLVLLARCLAENSTNEVTTANNLSLSHLPTWHLKDETMSSFSQSLLSRLSIIDWNAKHAYQPIVSQPSSYRPCASLQILPWGASVAATSFCYNGLVSFEVCKRILERSENCNGMTFVDWDVFRGKKFLWWVRNMGICKLFDRGDYGVEIHNESPAKFQNNSLVLLKLSSKYDNCTTLEESRKTDVDNNVNVSAIHKFEKCAPRIGRTKTYASQYSNTTRILPNDSEFAALPKLHIVVFVTESWLVNKKTEVDIIASHWSCYAKAHDYLFSLVSLPTMTVAEFFTRRHQYVLDELLHTAQYIAQMEADSFVINMGVSFERFLSQSQHSIHLQFRENGEVHSGIYILKNDMNSICFLEYWLSFFAPVIPELGPKPSFVPAWPIFIDNPNSDNGALVAAMALLLAKYTDSTDVYMKCLENLHPTRIRVYPEQHCLDILQTKLYYTFGPEAQDPKPGRIRVWWHREGFWRTSLHSRDAPEGRGHEDLIFFENLYKSCYPSSDFIGHGNKLTHLEIEPDQSTSCNIEKVRNATGGGRNPKCKWLSEQEELTLLRKHCQWRSPACMPGGRTTSAPGNNDLNNVCLYIPNENSTDTTTMRRNPNCKQSASTITFVETTG